MNKGKKILLYSACAVFAVFNLFLLAQNLKMKVLELASQEEEEEYTITQAHQIFTINDSFLNNGISLKGEHLTESHTGNETTLDNLFHDSPNRKYLVCRFSEYDCEQCILYSVGRMTDFVQQNNLELKPMIWGRFLDIHNLNVITNRIPGTENVSIYSSTDSIMPIDEHGNPYYFIIDQAMTVYDVFTPDKMDPDMTDLYLESISRKLSYAVR